MTPLPYRTIIELAPELRSGRISPEALLECMLERIAEHDPHYHAFLAVMRESALLEAGAAGEEIAAGRWKGPLHGIPIAVKDNCFTADAPTTNGLPSLPGGARHQQADAAVVRLLKKNGAVLLGKLNMSEAATFEHHPELPEPRNPWGDTLWTGASSSGSAVACAAGLSFGSLGSDTGGSIRVPAACNNLTGLRPTWGMVGHEGTFGSAAFLDTIGPIGRSVGDVAVLLDAIAGENLRASARGPLGLDMWGAPDPNRFPLAGLVLGIDPRFNALGADDETCGAIEAATRQFAELGAKVVSVDFPSAHDRIVDAAGLAVARAIADTHADVPEKMRSAYTEGLRGTIAFGAGADPQILQQIHARMAAFSDELSSLLEGIDAMLTPVLPRPMPTWQEFRQMLESDITGLLRYTMPMSIAGVPALALPAGVASDGRSISMQVVGRRNEDILVLRIGHAFQQATGWHRRHPGLEEGYAAEAHVHGE